MKILIAEDSLVLRRLYKVLCSKQDFECTICEDGNEAIMSYKDDYDLIILDIGMPVKNGVDVVRFLQAVNNTIPILIITAYSEKKVVELLEGYDQKYSFIRKPFNTTNFKKIVLKASNK